MVLQGSVVGVLPQWPCAIALSSSLSEVLPHCPSVPLSHVFLAVAVPFVEDTLPPSSEEDRNEIWSVKCQVTYPFLRGLP